MTTTKRTYQDFLQTISRTPTRDECAYLAAHMRTADIEEAKAFGALQQRENLEDYLWNAVLASESAVVIYAPESRKPIAIYGVCSFTSAHGVGFAWMHGTDALATSNKHDFLRLGRFGVGELQQAYRLLVCFADARNTLHTRWLHWTGFTPINMYPVFDPAVPFLEFILPGGKGVLCAHL